MKIPRFRTIIRLISGPAIIAGSLATFTLASASPAAAASPATALAATVIPSVLLGRFSAACDINGRYGS